jgi:hypothetical protein
VPRFDQNRAEELRVRCVTPVALLLLALGCAQYRTVIVRVIDGESEQLIPGATIHTYRYEHWPWWVQEHVRAYSAPEGVARVRAIRDALGVVAITPEAPGYLSYWATGANGDGQPTSNARMTELKPWPFDEVTLTLYAEPEPRVTLVIPDGYRGLAGR